MKKSFLILTLLFLLAATPTLANQGKDKANEHAKSNRIQGIEVSPTPIQSEPTNITPTEVTPTVVTPSPKACDPSMEYKNHGAYVSCVAKTHPGGKKVSEAAKSNIGKKKTPSITPSPIISPSASPTATITPSISPTEEPTPTATEPAETTNTEENLNLGQQIQGLIDKVNELLEMLKNLATN